jgi:hypothetical protein
MAAYRATQHPGAIATKAVKCPRFLIDYFVSEIFPAYSPSQRYFSSVRSKKVDGEQLNPDILFEAHQ